MCPEKNESIAVVGSSNYDVVVKVNEIPVVGETVLAWNGNRFWRQRC
jgi:hypothetical protein